MESGAGLPAIVRLLHGRVPAVAAVALGVLTVLLLGADANAVCWGAVQVVLVALAAEDVRSRRIPNAITGPASAAAIVLRVAFERSELVEILIAGAASFAVFLALALVVRGGLGMGDVKLAGLLGLLLGTAVVPALFLGTLAGGVASLAILARTRTRRTTMAYGPYLCLGGAVTILALNLPRLV
jgi:leader peptidase (prepilin peptidase) / N-methyltransferase